jgi:tRNA(fMet)-specific endonuclease VapC
LRSYLLDTNTITAITRGHATALTHLRNLEDEDEVYTCFVVLGEWEYGILNVVGKVRRDQIRADGDPVIEALTGTWDSTHNVSMRYGSLCANLRSRGQAIPVNDIWIAAVALEYGATLVTTDAHFKRVSELETADWTVP